MYVCMYTCMYISHQNRKFFLMISKRDFYKYASFYGDS